MKKDTKTLVMGILAYAGILFLIPLFAEKEDKWVRAHTKNGFVITVVSLVVGAVINLVGKILAIIPLIGAILGVVLSVIGWIVWVAGIAAMVYGIYLVVTDKDASDFPVVSTAADNFLKFLD